MSDKQGPVEREIERRIREKFTPTYLELDNESHGHNVAKDSETHFRLVVVSEVFNGQSRIQRQRSVNETLADLMKPGGVHALTQKTLTNEEWEKSGGKTEFVSPPCHGGSKR